MTSLAVAEPGAFIAVGALVASVVAGIVAVVKLKPETEALAVRTTLEVNEALREEVREARTEAEEARRRLRKSREEIDMLQLRLGEMRANMDAMEAELASLRREVTD